MKGYHLSEEEYFDFIAADYKANPFEGMEGDKRFIEQAHNAWVNGQRFHRMLQCFSHHQRTLPENPLAVDIGLYPGTWIQLVRHFFSDIKWHGVGLCISDRFRQWAEDEKIELSEADMDPFYSGFSNTDVAQALPHANESVDHVVASEIFEHLISPLLFLQESARVLKPGGLMLMTTPNVSNFGAVVNLLRGKSNYERLERSPMFLVEDEWRGHIRFYSKEELVWLAGRYGLEMIDHQYYHDDYPESALRNNGISSSVKRLIRRTFGLVPWFRGGHIMMFQKKRQ